MIFIVQQHELCYYNDILNRGDSLMKKLFILLTLSVSLIISGCLNRDKYSLNQFESVKLGMSYYECTMILKDDGKLVGENYIPGLVHTKLYSWKNKNGSNMLLMFQDNQLVQKNQYGLK